MNTNRTQDTRCVCCGVSSYSQSITVGKLSQGTKNRYIHINRRLHIYKQRTGKPSYQQTSISMPPPKTQRPRHSNPSAVERNTRSNQIHRDVWGCERPADRPPRHLRGPEGGNRAGFSGGESVSRMLLGRCSLVSAAGNRVRGVAIIGGRGVILGDQPREEEERKEETCECCLFTVDARRCVDVQCGDRSGLVVNGWLHATLQ